MFKTRLKKARKNLTLKNIYCKGGIVDKSRTELLIGKENIELIASKKIAIVGVGGVGGALAISLARCGVENFTLIDFDKVSASNINRQVVAFEQTIGKNKVDVLKEMILAINKNAKVNAVAQKICKENVKELISDFDLVVDAIDSVQDKVELICHCKENNINIISSMGAGNRVEVPNFEIADIYKTHNDGLAKALRKKLKERGVKNLEVVFTSQKPIENNSKVIGSIAYFPIICGNILCSAVINKILRREI